MAKPTLVLFVALFALFPLALSAQTQHLKFTNDGAFASLTVDTDPFSRFTLQVSRSTTGSTTTTNISFFAFSISADHNFETVTQVIGTIPNDAFAGVNTQNLALNLDPSALDPATSLVQSCVVDLTTITFTCGPLPPGTLSLTFQGDGFQQTRLLAQEEFTTFGPFTIHTHQRADTSSASAQGTVFGTSISSSSATVGINHLSTLEFTRN
jgi:hypothetical protein